MTSFVHCRTVHVLFLFCTTWGLNAQTLTYNWARAVNAVPGSSNTVTNVAVDKQGNVYSSGDFFGTVDLDPGPGTALYTAVGYSDAFLLKLDALGRFIWARQFGGPGEERGFCVGVDMLGNPYVSGKFQGTVDLDPGPAVQLHTSVPIYGTFVAKLDPAGNLLWAGQTGGHQIIDYGNYMKVIPAGYVFIAGRFQGTVDFDPGPGTFNMTATSLASMHISVLRPDGTLAWARQVRGTPGSSVEGCAITVDDRFNVYVTGDFQGTMDFDPGVGVSNLTATSAQGDIFVLKLRGNGDFQWVRRTNGGLAKRSKGVVVDRERNALYHVGHFQGMVDFDPDPEASSTLDPFGTQRTGYITKLDTDGNFKWAKRMGGTGSDTRCRAITLAQPEGNVFVIGSFSSTMAFEPDPGIATLTSAGSNDVFMASLGARSGKWNKAWRLGGSSYDLGLCINGDMANTLHLGGEASGAADVDPEGGVTPLNASPLAAFVEKIATRCYDVSDLVATRAGPVLSAKLDLRWTPANCPVDHYRLYYRKNTSPTYNTMDLPGNANTFRFAGENGSRVYLFHIRPVYPGGSEGADSNVATAAYIHPLPILDR